MFSVNTLSKKNIDEADKWLHLKDDKDKPAMINDKPVRIKIAGFHSDFYGKEASHLAIKIGKLTGEIKEKQQEADKLSDREVAEFMYDYHKQIREEELTFYTEVTKGWENMPDSEGGEAEFTKENVYRLYEQNPMVLKQLKEAVKENKDFTLE